jgi:hypothetical protein
MFITDHQISHRDALSILAKPSQGKRKASGHGLGYKQLRRGPLRISINQHTWLSKPSAWYILQTSLD